MSTNLEARLRSPWGRLAFALIWVGMLSAAWPYIKSSGPLHALATWGARHDFIVALLLTAAVYLAAVVLVLWIGVVVYLAASRQLAVKNLFRGFTALFFILLIAQGILSFARTTQLSYAAEYTLTWLPMYIAFFFALKLSVPSTRRFPFTRASAN